MTGTVLITGGRGYLGCHAQRAFADAGWRVVDLDARPRRALAVGPAVEQAVHVRLDLRATGSVVDLLRRERPSHCVQMAGPSSVSASIRHPREDLEGHVLPTLSLLEAVHASGADTAVLVVSSAAVYGSPDRLPITEDHPVQPVSPYGCHSRIKELVAAEHRARHGVRVCIARLFSTYGPGLRRMAVWDIARRAMRGELTARGTGRESRDYLHARDAAAALVAICMRTPFAGEVVNVGSGEETEVRCLAGRIYSALGIAASCRFDGRVEAGKPLRWQADASTLRDLGFEPRIALETGVLETVRWIFRARQPAAPQPENGGSPSASNVGP